MKQHLTRAEWDAYRRDHPDRARQLLLHYSLFTDRGAELISRRDVRRMALDGFPEWFTIGRMIEWLQAWGTAATYIDQGFEHIVIDGDERAGGNLGIGWSGHTELCDALWSAITVILAE